MQSNCEQLLNCGDVSGELSRDLDKCWTCMYMWCFYQSVLFWYRRARAVWSELVSLMVLAVLTSCWWMKSHHRFPHGRDSDERQIRARLPPDGRGEDGEVHDHTTARFHPIRSRMGSVVPEGFLDECDERIRAVHLQRLWWPCFPVLSQFFRPKQGSTSKKALRLPLNSESKWGRIARRKECLATCLRCEDPVEPCDFDWTCRRCGVERRAHRLHGGEPGG